jgi:hypothetical protein
MPDFDRSDPLSAVGCWACVPKAFYDKALKATGNRTTLVFRPVGRFIARHGRT